MPSRNALFHWLILVCLALSACAQSTATPSGTPSDLPTATGGPGVTDTAPGLPTPEVETTRPPDPREAARDFLEAWRNSDYTRMYGMVTSLTQDAITAEDFTNRYQSAAASLTLVTLDYELLSALTNPSSAQVNYRVTFHTGLMGDLKSSMVMNLTLEGGPPGSAWKVQWEDGLIMNELAAGNHLTLEVDVPARGNIYDREGHALAAFADAVALGVVPGDINPDLEGTLLRLLSELTGKTGEAIEDAYKYAAPSWYIPIGEASADAVQKRYDALSALTPGLRMNPFRSRYYYDGGAAPHTIGYLLSISPEEMQDYQRQGYLADEKVGKAGLEKWGEKYLRGQPRAALYVVNPQGQTVTRLAEISAQPAQSIYTTLDKDLQLKIQKSMGDLRGSVVVMEVETGRILAMVSSPSFDSNLFEPTNYNSYGTSQLGDLYSDLNRPLLNRATQGAYPLGSVFKIVTMAAGLESGLFTPDYEYTCGYAFTDLGVPLYDWTYNKGYPASGPLTLTEGLIRSCNPFFAHLGLEIFRSPEHYNDVVEMARAFGLGSATGVDQVAEVEGSMPDPEDESTAVHMAIGQGQMLVTPLQVVDFIAAIANGGTLYRPQVVEQIAPLDGEPTLSFKPEERGKLPISEDTLRAIQNAMTRVVTSTKPLGTAHHMLANMGIPVAGKTGTAETSYDEPHAWFAGYTMAHRENKPDIAVVVMLENAGEGSEMAAPLFRRAVQLYFSDGQNPGPVMPWESRHYVLATPEPSPEPTEIPAPTETPAPEATPEP